MIILQNKEQVNKVFIEDSMFEHCDIQDGESVVTITPKRRSVHVIFKREHLDYMVLNNVCLIEYTGDSLLNFKCRYGEVEALTLQKEINIDELFSMEFVGDSIYIDTCKIPTFMYEEGFDSKYPKFEINLSDCVHAMKIYLTEDSFIEVSRYQTHYNIKDTIEYIQSLVLYLSEENPLFIEDLCTHSKLNLSIKIDDELRGPDPFNYEMTEDGIHLMFLNTDEELDIEWHKVFKLIMDGKWVIEFIEE